VAEVPFTSERKRMTTVHASACRPEDRRAVVLRRHVAFAKGAVDSLLEIRSGSGLATRASH
jgi:magnesium-transporting ATPase (P-type)